MSHGVPAVGLFVEERAPRALLGDNFEDGRAHVRQSAAHHGARDDLRICIFAPVLVDLSRHDREFRKRTRAAKRVSGPAFQKTLS